jgi:hypothetical protein
MAALLGVALAASASRALAPLQTHMTPPTQPPLTVIDGRDISPVRDLFNRDASVPRILILLSPT